MKASMALSQSTLLCGLKKAMLGTVMLGATMLSAGPAAASPTCTTSLCKCNYTDGGTCLSGNASAACFDYVGMNCGVYCSGLTKNQCK